MTQNVPWTQQVSAWGSLLSLTVTLWMAHRQRKLQTELAKLTAVVEFAEGQEPRIVRVRLTVFNAGPVPVTLTKFGLLSPNGDVVYEPKWKTKGPSLPVQLTQGAPVTMDYYEDQIDQTPGLLQSRIAIAELASGKKLCAKIKNLSLWTCRDGGRLQKP